MRVESGLFEHGVLQRVHGASDAAVAGQCRRAGAVRARVTREGVALDGLDGAEVGAAANGLFTARLAGIPTGGPYTVELWIDGSQERVQVADVLVGDVWVLGGQSNMQGCGLLANDEPAHPLVRAWYMDDRWAVARDPLHNLWDAVDPVHTELFGGGRPARAPGRGVGPGVAFAIEMHRRTGVPQGVLACAHGGTSMSQWDPVLKRRGGHSLYGATLRRVAKVGGRVAGLVWYQGCSDAGPEAAPHYTRRMRALIRAFRRDLGCPELPVVTVQIARVFGATAFPAWNSIQEQQRCLPDRIRGLAVVPAVDLPLDDQIHISGAGQHRLGRRLAETMLALLRGEDARPIRVRRLRVAPRLPAGTADIIVEFDRVNGSLRASGLPWGFAIEGGPSDQVIYDVTLDGSRAILHTSLGIVEAQGCRLWYGRGTTTYCNITDDADRALPVFGPLSIGKPRALTAFFQRLRVSRVLPLADSLAVLPYPTAPQALGLQTQVFPQPLADLHLELGAEQTSRVVYYACRFACPETMRLDLLLGYDGPVKVWLDGAPVYHDPRGTNPALPDEAAIPVTAEAGEHEALIALDANNGKAWGIFLRLERRDVTKAQLAGGPGRYILPEFIE